jgi:hypothetical protein
MEVEDEPQQMTESTDISASSPTTAQCPAEQEAEVEALAERDITSGESALGSIEAKEQEGPEPAHISEQPDEAASIEPPAATPPESDSVSLANTDSNEEAHSTESTTAPNPPEESEQESSNEWDASDVDGPSEISTTQTEDTEPNPSEVSAPSTDGLDNTSRENPAQIDVADVEVATESATSDPGMFAFALLFLIAPFHFHFHFHMSVMLRTGNWWSLRVRWRPLIGRPAQAPEQHPVRLITTCKHVAEPVLGCNAYCVRPGIATYVVPPNTVVALTQVLQLLSPFVVPILRLVARVATLITMRPRLPCTLIVSQGCS